VANPFEYDYELKLTVVEVESKVSYIIIPLFIVYPIFCYVEDAEL